MLGGRSLISDRSVARSNPIRASPHPARVVDRPLGGHPALDMLELSLSVSRRPPPGHHSRLVALDEGAHFEALSHRPTCSSCHVDDPLRVEWAEAMRR